MTAASLPLLLLLLPLCSFPLLSRVLSREYGVRRAGVHVALATASTLSLDLLLLVIFEVADILLPSTRALVWRGVLSALAVTLALVLPLYSMYLLALSRGLKRWAARLSRDGEVRRIQSGDQPMERA